MSGIKINKRQIDLNNSAYFIADIAANHDGEFSRAIDLISLAKEAGADAIKFQHFRAEKIVSELGFRVMESQLGHQAKWHKSVFEIYQDASLDWEWTEKLAEHSRKEKIDFFSSPYDFGAVDHLEPFVPAYKIGSGDITWLEIIEHMAQKDVPIILATGASTMDEVIHAVTAIEKHNRQIGLMQCNTNYTGEQETIRYTSLNVLKTYAQMYPDYVLGLSDHTPGHTTVLGAVALGARLIEKHFTDDTKRTGPDHGFSMTPETWKAMVEATRELESAMGMPVKRIADNEKETMVVQRRCLRACQDIKEGKILTRDDIDVLRPAPMGSLPPSDIDSLLGKTASVNISRGEHFTARMIK